MELHDEKWGEEAPDIGDVQAHAVYRRLLYFLDAIKSSIYPTRYQIDDVQSAPIAVGNR